MFRLNRNERSHWSGNGVHVESELVFMIGRNMHEQRRYVPCLHLLFSMWLALICFLFPIHLEIKQKTNTKQ